MPCCSTASRHLTQPERHGRDDKPLYQATMKRSLPSIDYACFSREDASGNYDGREDVLVVIAREISLVSTGSLPVRPEEELGTEIARCQAGDYGLALYQKAGEWGEPDAELWALIWGKERVSTKFRMIPGAPPWDPVYRPEDASPELHGVMSSLLPAEQGNSSYRLDLSVFGVHSLRTWKLSCSSPFVLSHQGERLGESRGDREEGFEALLMVAGRDPIGVLFPNQSLSLELEFTRRHRVDGASRSRTPDCYLNGAGVQVESSGPVNSSLRFIPGPS